MCPLLLFYFEGDGLKTLHSLKGIGGDDALKASADLLQFALYQLANLLIHMQQPI